MNTRYLELFGISNKYLSPLANSSGKQLLGISNSRYLKQFSDPFESSKYRESTVINSNVHKTKERLDKLFRELLI